MKYFYMFLLIFNFLPLHAENVGILYNPKYKLHTAIADIFKLKISEEGYNIINVKYSSDDINNLAFEINLSKCSYCFSIGNIPSLACKKTKIPGVFTMVIDPKKYDFIDDFGRINGNLTGVLVDVDPNFQFSIFEKLFKMRTHGGIVYNADTSEYYVKNLKSVSESYGYKIIASPIKLGENINKSIYDLKSSIDFVLTLADLSLYNLSNIEKIIQLSILQKLPLVGFSKIHVKNGALIGFYSDDNQLAIQAAELMIKLIKNNGDVSLTPVEFTKKPNYSINLQTAKIMRIEIPDEIKKQANIL